jgi:hypothetical protein
LHLPYDFGILETELKLLYWYDGKLSEVLTADHGRKKLQKKKKM